MKYEVSFGYETLPIVRAPNGDKFVPDDLGTTRQSTLPPVSAQRITCHYQYPQQITKVSVENPMSEALLHIAEPHIVGVDRIE